MTFDNIKLVAEAQSLFSVKDISFLNSIIEATGSTLFNPVDALTLENNEITLNNSVLLDHLSEDCNRKSVDIL